MPAPTASRRSANSWGLIDLMLWGPCAAFAGGRGVGTCLPAAAVFLVRGKFSHCLRDLGRAGHEELLLRTVKRHRGNVGRGDAHNRPIEIPECVLRDDRRHLAAEATCEVVL